MSKLFISLLLLIFAGHECFAKEVFYLSSYRTSYAVDLSLKTTAGENQSVNKDFLNAFLVAKKAIEVAANLPPFDAALINDEKFNAAMVDNGLRGNLLITIGALNQIKDDVELSAALIGHEAGHYIHKHREKQYERHMSATIISAVVLGAASRNSGVPLRHDTAVNLGKSLAISFGKEDEHEADLEGFKLVAKAGYDQNSFFRLLEILLKNSQGRSFFSSHPHPEDRINRIKSLQPSLIER